MAPRWVWSFVLSALRIGHEGESYGDPRRSHAGLSPRSALDLPPQALQVRGRVQRPPPRAVAEQASLLQSLARERFESGAVDE